MTIVEAYAHALHKAVLKHPEQAERYADNLQKIVEKRRHEKLLPAIVRRYQRIVSSMRSDVSTVTVASKHDLEKYRKEISEAKNALGLSPSIQEVENDSLIGGYVVQGKGKRIDGSYKRMLIALYRYMTSNV